MAPKGRCFHNFCLLVLFSLILPAFTEETLNPNGYNILRCSHKDQVPDTWNERIDAETTVIICIEPHPNPLPFFWEFAKSKYFQILATLNDEESGIKDKPPATTATTATKDGQQSDTPNSTLKTPLDIATHEAFVNVTCTGGTFNVLSAAESASLGDLIFSADDKVKEVQRLVQATQSMWSTAAIFSCPPPKELTDRPDTCLVPTSPLGKTCMAVKVKKAGVDCTATCKLQPAKWMPIPLANQLRIHRFLALIAAYGLWRMAKPISESVGFHYTACTTVGVLASFLVIMYILSRSFNGRWSQFGIVFLGVTGNFGGVYYMISALIANGPWWEVTWWRDYWKPVMAYMGTAAAISFGTTYWFLNRGRGENDVAGMGAAARTLLRYLMQMTALYLAYQCSATVHISVVAVALLLFGAPLWEMLNWCFGSGEYFVAGKPRSYLKGGFVSAETVRERSAEATKLAMMKLSQSRGFGRWMAANHDRIRMAPREPDE